MTRRDPAAIAGFAVALGLAGGLTLAGCGEATGAAPAGLPTSATGVRVAGAWIRPTPPITNVAAFYLRVENGGSDADRVVAASSPRCAEIEIHQTTTVDGVASMSLASDEQLSVEPGHDLVFEPNGLHVMCLGLDEPVVEGEAVPLTVQLEIAGSLTVDAVAENR